MEPQYVAKRSALFDFHFFICLLLLIAFLIPEIIYIIYKNLSAHSNVIEFYEDKYILKSGIVNTHNDEVVFKGVLSVSVNQTLGGKMFNYGSVKVDVAGKNNIVLGGVKNPNRLKDYLQSRKINVESLSHTMTN